MPVLITKTIYLYHELTTSEAQAAARGWYQKERGIEEYYSDDDTGSLIAFCGHFGVKLNDYNDGYWGPRYIHTTATKDNFRGLKLKDFNCAAWREKELTGYSLDYTLTNAFADAFEETGNALHAFNKALTEGLRVITKQIEYYLGDDYAKEYLQENDDLYFLEDGTHTNDDPSQPYCDVA